MDSITVKAWAKINPYLEVLYKRQDGYHEIRSVMQTLGLYDSVYIKKINKYPFRLVCEPDRLPCDERNLVYRAAMYIINEYSISQGIFIKLTKRIPISAGLGGGSSDCAATLAGLNKLLGLRIPFERLMEIGGTFGADVPFCLMKGTVLAEGIGEKCTPLAPHPHTWVVLARPPAIVSTPSIFKGWKRTGSEPGIKLFLEALESKDIDLIASRFYNSLQDVTSKLHPEILAAIDALKRGGALGASMSGSGPTVFGYFASRESARLAADVLKKEQPSVREVFITSI